MLEVKKYDLPDYSIFENENNCFKFWIPDKKYIILGASNTPEDSLITENVIAEKIPVYKRPSGGQTVLISPKMIVISALLVNPRISSKEIFYKINASILSTLKKIIALDFSLKGISDIAVGDKKILGSSIYHSKEKYFYHAVLNVSEPPGTIAKYLKHPSKEPDYRKGRNHRDFITSLKNCGINSSINEIQVLLENNFSTQLIII